MLSEGKKKPKLERVGESAWESEDGDLVGTVGGLLQTGTQVIDFREPGLRWSGVSTEEEGVQESWDWEELGWRPGEELVQAQLAGDSPAL